MLSNRYVNNNVSCLKLNSIQRDQKTKIQEYIESGYYMFEDTPCLICESNNYEALSEKDRYGLYMPVVICRDCGLVQASPRMTQESYNHFYNDNHRRLYVGSEAPTEAYFKSRYHAGKETFDFLSQHIEVAGKRILEVGCGSGAILKYLHDNGATVKGIDLSREYLEYGRAKYDLDLTNTDLFELPENAEYDVVIYSDVLEHIAKPILHLRKIKKLLKEDGLLYIKVPGVKNTFRPYLADFLKSIQNAHIYYYTLPTLHNLMGASGFRMIYGDETIRSLWRVSTKTNPEPTNDYKACMAYLHHLEKQALARKLLPPAAWCIAKVRQLLSN